MQGLYSIVSGLCLLLVFILYLRMMSSVARSEKRDIYVSIMIAGMIYLATDVLWGVIYDSLLPIPSPVQKLIYAVYYAMASLISYRWFLYVEYMQESFIYKNQFARRISMIPMIFVVGISFLSMWTGMFFYINDQGLYCRGDWYIPQLVMTYGYIIFAAGKLTLRLLMTKDFEAQNTYMIMISYFVFPVVFGILQVYYPERPFLCIGVALATLQTYLFYVTYEKERELSSSKIHSLTRLFISSYFLNLQTGKSEYLSKEEERTEAFLTGDFYKNAPDRYEDAISAYVENFVHKEDQEKYISMTSKEFMVNNLSEEKQFYFFNYRQVVNGVEKWYRMHVIAASFLANKEVGSVVMAIMDVDKQVCNDISQKAAVEEALVQAEKANKAKSDFLSSMSHDIRTPMNAIMGFTSLAQNHIEDVEKVENYLGKILSAGKHLLNLINDILDMSRIESGKLHIQEDEVSLKEVISDVENLIQSVVDEKNLNFNVKEEIVNNYVFCDKLRLNQILINLLGNAVKFTPDGGYVSLEVKQEMIAPEGYGVYLFKVKDTGIGIAKEFQPRIFEAFEREKMTEKTGIQGTGLGLAITKNIVEMMGGRISLESDLGRGTEFTVKVMFALQNVDEAELAMEDTVEQKALREQKEQEYQRALFENRKLLLVEDNNLNREIARILLREQGFIVDEAVNGQEAVEKIAKAEDGEYALVLMDIQMPIKNGYEATKEIRALSNRRLAHIPIIAMTANAFEEEKKEALDCGMNGHVTKPIDVNILFKTIEGILN